MKRRTRLPRAGGLRSRVPRLVSRVYPAAAATMLAAARLVAAPPGLPESPPARLPAITGESPVERPTTIPEPTPQQPSPEAAAPQAQAPAQGQAQTGPAPAP